MFNVLEVLSKCVAILMVGAAFFAFVAFSPTIFCHGGGAGGNCGEGYLASLPIAMVLTPAVLIFGTIYFFRSTKKVMLTILAFMAAAVILPPSLGQLYSIGLQNYRWSHPTKEMKDDALRSYTDCLQMRAKSWAYRRDDISRIESLLLEKCARGRQAYLNQFPNDADTVAVAERVFHDSLPSMIASQWRR